MSSSPPRRLLDPRNLPKLTIRRRPRLRCRLFSCAFLCVFWIYYCVSQRTRNSSRRSERTPDHTPFTKDEVSNKSSRPTIFEDVYDPGALAAILPVTSSSFPRLSEKLSGLSDIPHLSEVYLICPENITSVVRHRLRQTLHQIRNFGRTEFFVTLWRHDWTEAASILEVASNILSGVILILPQDALVGIDSTSRGILFSGSPLLPVPLGLRGSGIRCDARYQGFLAARFVLPPLVLPSRLGVKNQSYFHLTSWQELGAHFTRAGGVGGVVPPGTLESTGTCDDMDTLEMVTSDFANFNPPSNSSNALLVILAAERGDVAGLLALACEFKSRGTEVEVVAYGIPSDSDHRPDPASEGCEVAITEVRRLRDPVVAQFPGHTLGVILTLVEYHFLPESLLGANGTETVIRIPRSDLPHCDWIASLRLQELRNWHIPRVEISVITNDRPSSLNRLLQSLSSSRYFGDKVNIRINIEQDADYDTLELIDRWSWEHGSIFLNRRVIHAGLLPAVVESWYPHTNNSYGLILEDDVEVSPLFYGWLKMNLLRYRYGGNRNRSTRVFGISLYQPKVIETRQEGRAFFNPRTVFAANDIIDYTTPYLSQIPCSWGAIYFPEHWREFHSYLNLRLSEVLFDIDAVVVPGARSNRWSKSWKKYFIELAYLRGYVMVYPNYDNFVSLSTNHLETGSHVKDISRESYVRKREMFRVPLIGLGGTTELTDLPHRTLPALNSLPVLNIFGQLSSLEALILLGEARQSEIVPTCEPSRKGQVRPDFAGLLCATGTE